MGILLNDKYKMHDLYIINKKDNYTEAPIIKLTDKEHLYFCFIWNTK